MTDIYGTKNVVTLSTDCPQYEQAIDKRLAMNVPWDDLITRVLHKVTQQSRIREEASWSATIVIEGWQRQSLNQRWLKAAIAHHLVHQCSSSPTFSIGPNFACSRSSVSVIERQSGDRSERHQHLV